MNEKITLQDIRDLMTSYLDSVKPESEDSKYYDEDGHCGFNLWTKNRNFWSGFDSDEDFIYLVSGRYAEDEIDLDGGRDYFLIRSGVAPLLFRYMVENLGWSKEDYRKVIYNSLELSDDLIYMYGGSGKESKNERIQWRSFSNHLKDDDQVSKLEPIVLKYPESMRLTVNLNKDLKFIGNSRIDGSPMYMIMFPSGFSVVNNIDTYTNR